MAGKRNEEEQRAQLLASIVIADLTQLEADAETHPDSAVRKRMLAAVNRLRHIAEGDVSDDILEAEE